MANDFWPANHVLCIVEAITLSAAVISISIFREDSSLAFLLLFALIGVLRTIPLKVERHQAHEIVKLLSDNAPRIVGGTVSSVTDESTEGFQKFVLSDVTISGGSREIRLPGRVAVVATEEPTTQSHRALYFPGARLRAAAVIEEPAGFSNFFLPDYRETAARNRIYATAHIPSEKLIDRQPDSDAFIPMITDLLAETRRYLADLLDRNLPEHESRLLNAMLFNTRTMLSEEDHRVFRDSGTMHLLVVSGLHVAILAYIILTLLRAFRIGIRPAWSAVVIILFLYVWLLGFIAPALRAFLMVLSYSVGRWIGREVDNVSSLGLGTSVILAVDPMALWDASFVLSVVGVFGLVLFAPLFAEWLGDKRVDSPPWWQEWPRHWLSNAFCVMCAATLMLLPLQFFYFQQFNLLSPFANIVEAGLSIFLLGAALATISFGLLYPPLGAIAGNGAAIIMKAVYSISYFVSRQEWAIIHTARVPVSIVLGYYMILLSGYYMVRRDTPEFRMKAAARLSLHAAAALTLLIIGVGARFWPQGLRIYFLDVGQGDSTLILLPSGQSLLVDAGNVIPDLGKLVVEPELKVLGVRPLDNLMATHADGDHIGGMPFLLWHYPVRIFAEGTDRPPDNELIREIDDANAARGVEIRELRAGQRNQIDLQTCIEVLNPMDGVSTSTTSDNNQGVVLRLTYGKFTALLMADAEQPVEERLVAEGIGPCDVLKAGHHGSKTSSTEPFIAAVNPTVAIISCGRHNRYGHPNADVLKRLDEHDAKIYRTDRTGAVLVESDGNSYTVTTSRQSLD